MKALDRDGKLVIPDEPIDGYTVLWWRTWGGDTPLITASHATYNAADDRWEVHGENATFWPGWAPNFPHLLSVHATLSDAQLETLALIQRAIEKAERRLAGLRVEAEAIMVAMREQ
jgi:hypothetical protein